MEPIIQPGDLPISVSIPGGISPGRCIVVEGKVPDNADSFSIRLQCGAKVNGREDIPLSVKFTFEDNHGDFLVTSMLDEEWGVEESRMTKENLWYIWGSEEPLSPGDSCCIAVECHDMGFKIFLDSEEVHDYMHRTDYAHIGYLVLIGDFEVASAGVVGGIGPTRWLIMATAEPETWNTRVVTLLNDENYSNKILHSSYMWVIIFYSPPCQMKSEFELAALKISTLLRGKVRFGSVNCLVNIDTATAMKVHRCPTILYYPKGSRKSLTVAQRYTGAYSAAGIGNWVSHVYQELRGPPPGLNASMPVQQPILLVTKLGMQKARPDDAVTPDTLDSEYWNKASMQQDTNDLVDRRVSFKDENCVYCAHDNTFTDADSKEHLITLLDLDRRLSDLIKRNLEKQDTLVVEEKDLFGTQNNDKETAEDIEKIKQEIAMEIRLAQEEENEERGREKGIEAEKDEIEEAQKKLVREFRERVLSAENTLINKSVSVINLYIPELRKELREFMQAIQSVERARCILAKVQNVYKGKNEPGTSKPQHNIVDEVFSEKIFPTDPNLDSKGSYIPIISKPIESTSSSTDKDVNRLRNILSSINLMQPPTEQPVGKESKSLGAQTLTKNWTPTQSPSLIENITNCINLHSITRICETCQENNIAAFNEKVSSSQNQNNENVPHKSILKKVSKIQTENAEEVHKDHSKSSLEVVKSKVVINTNTMKLETPSKTSTVDRLPTVCSSDTKEATVKENNGKSALCKSHSSIRNIISRIFGLAYLHIKPKSHNSLDTNKYKTDSVTLKLENNNEENKLEEHNLKDEKVVNLSELEPLQGNEEFASLSYTLSTPVPISDGHDSISSVTTKEINNEAKNATLEETSSKHSIINETKSQNPLNTSKSSTIVDDAKEIINKIIIPAQIAPPKHEISENSVNSGNEPQNSFETSEYSSGIDNTNEHETIVSVDVTMGTEELHLGQISEGNEVIIIKHNNAMEMTPSQRRTFMLLCDTETGSSEIQIDSSVTEEMDTISQTSETAKESTENWSPVEKPSKNSLADELMRHLTELQLKEAAATAKNDSLTQNSSVNKVDIITKKSLTSLTRKRQYETKIIMQEIEFCKIVEVKVDKINKNIVQSKAVDKNFLMQLPLAPSVKSIERSEDVSGKTSSSENLEFSSRSQSTNNEIIKKNVPVPLPLVTSVKPFRRSNSAPMADVPTTRDAQIIATSSDTALVPRSNVLALEATRLMGLFTREQRERWWARLLSRRAAHCRLI